MSPVALPALNNKGGVISFQDAFRETVNVAMGRAAALLAKVLGVFVQLPVPNVNMLEVGELHMALADAHSDQRLTAVCQGYIGGGIAGEALLIFHDSEISGISQLMGGDHSDSSDMEMLLDLSTILIGACLSGIAEQIDIAFRRAIHSCWVRRAASTSLSASINSAGKRPWRSKSVTAWKATICISIC